MKSAAWKLVFLLVIFNGCSRMNESFFAPTLSDVRAFARLQREQLDAHDANMTEQNKLMSPEAARIIDLLREQFDRYHTDIGIRNTEIEQSVKSVHRTVSDSMAVYHNLRGESASTREALVGLKLEITTLAEALSEQRARIQEVETSNLRSTESAEKRQRNVEELFDNTNRAISFATETTSAEFKAALQVTDADRTELRNSINLKVAKLEVLSGMSWEEIALIIAAAGAAAAIGLAGGRAGRSRRHAELVSLVSLKDQLASTQPDRAE